MNDSKRLVLIDGHAILHRAFHALPPNFSTPSGEPSNAVYGFTTMMLRILTDLKPDYLAVAFDVPAPTFRQQAYTAYQSRRPEMPVKLDGQITLAHEMLTALRSPFFEVAGFEADDCIGTLATQAADGLPTTDYRKSAKGYAVDSRRLTVDEVYIVTGDRDMLQLVNDKVKVYVPIKGLSETKTYDEKLIQEEFGVKPSQWVDVKALKGDSSDNYPGVAGIGPKTACDLIAKYGTLENLYGKLGELGKFGKSGETIARKLAEGAEEAGLAKKLATIAIDVPIHLDLEAARVDKIDWQGGMKFMREKLGFSTIPKRIEKEILHNEVPEPPKKKVSNDNEEIQMKLID